ncbi:neurexophilin and pc-esterase domain family, member 5 [Plakobranchus ocellatus]|uniref:Neurexophilin and pc-esterase domain family, member 5 n=1 Tax=Plakobranchus ocellatus TaxID=259542 RepID=A0AAV4AGL1_9GAST|nr:neurexophilin and pc-esterase domain family, member 5 [Plakobranchus ocellatus]
MKSLRYVAAGYLGASDSEATLCLPFPRIPGYKTLCNFTARNHGQPWYCGHPRKPSLRCADWTIMRDLEFPKPLPLTAAEDVALATAVQKPVPRLVKQDLSLTVTSGQHPSPPPCDPFNFTHTWLDPTPRGFFYHKIWVPTTCTVPPPHAELWLRCLRDTTIIFAGDSNLLMWFSRIKQRINCQRSPGLGVDGVGSIVDSESTLRSEGILLSQARAPSLAPWPDGGPESLRLPCCRLESRARKDMVWHTPLTCRRPDINFNMSWKLHGYPEHPNSNHWAQLSDFTSACERIDTVPSIGKYVVIVHLYIHFTIHHYSVFLNRLKCVRRATEDLLRRNPNARVMIRAPHHAYNGWNPIYGGDLTVPIYIQLLRREFKGLYHKVIFLNLWDMTVAGENTDYHPDEWIDQQMVNFALSHACNMAPSFT